MNNKNFMNTLLFSAALLSTGMMSSCDDYDDDINALNDRVSAVETSIAELQKQIQEGKWVTSFERNSTNTGYVLVLSDGSKLEIKDGEKGDTGAAGVNGTSWEIDAETKNWIRIDADSTRTDTGVCAEGTKGDKGDQGEQGEQGIPGVAGPAGEEGKSPYIENGRWMVWDATEAAYVDGGSAVGTASYVVEFDAYWELNIVIADAEGNATEEFHKIILPKTADVSSLEVYAYDEESETLSEPSIELVLGMNSQGEEVVFDNVSYPAGAILVSNNATLVAQVNPMDVDASLYKFYLRNSKGETKFVVSDATPNISNEPLKYTRSAEDEEGTPNKGLWNLSLSIPESVTIENDKAVYSLQTTSITDETTVIASRYDINVDVVSGSTKTPVTQEADFEVGTLSWSEFLKDALSNYEDWNAAAYYLSIKEASTAQAQRDGVSIDKENKTITFSKGIANAINYVMLNYMGLDGTTYEGDTEGVSLRFTVTSTSEGMFAEPFVYDLNDASENVITVDINGLDALNNFCSDSELSGTFITKTITADENQLTYAFANEVVVVDGIEVEQLNVDLNSILGNITITGQKNAQGFWEWSATMTFDETMVYAENYTGGFEMTNNNGEKKKFDFTIEVIAPEAYNFTDKVNTSYVTSDGRASAFSTINADGTSSYDLYNLFSIPVADKEFITFTEILPEKTDGEFPYPELGRQWITTDESNNITVPAYNGFDGAYSERTMSINYRPFNNPNLSVSSYEFKLTVRSSIYEGTFEYNSNLSNQTLETGKSIVLKRTDITAVDFFGASYDFTSEEETRIVKYEITWDSNAQTYLNVGETSVYDENGQITVTRSESQTAVIEDTPCVGTITITDAWGRTLSTTITITVKKNDVKE